MPSTSQHPTIALGNHTAFMRHATHIASLSPPSPTKFCVGADLVNGSTGEILSTGYSQELPGNISGDAGNTHAEQCCFIKIALQHSLPAAHAEEHIQDVLPENTVLYTTMEPCNRRLSGNRTCCDRIVALRDRVKVVYVGIREPGTFIEENDGKGRLQGEGVRVEMVQGVEGECYEVAMAGHEKRGE